MQKVTSILPSWDKTKSGSKAGFDKVWKGLGMYFSQKDIS